MTRIALTSHGYKLAGNLFRAARPQKLAFLFIQGWTGHQNVKAAQKLADIGYTSMTYDMRGNRESEGDLATFSRADFLSDAANAYDYLKEQVSADTRIGIVGSSFGSYTAVLLSAEREVHCLALRVPASYPDEGFAEPQEAQVSESLRVWRTQAVAPTENKAFQALHDFSGQVLIIEAGSDEIVPRQTPRNYANAIADPSRLQYQVMNGAPHSLVNDELQAAYERLLIDWVQTTI